MPDTVRSTRTTGHIIACQIPEEHSHIAADIDTAISCARNTEHDLVAAIPYRHAIAELQKKRADITCAIEALQANEPLQAIGALAGCSSGIHEVKAALVFINEAKVREQMRLIEGAA